MLREEPTHTTTMRGAEESEEGIGGCAVLERVLVVRARVAAFETPGWRGRGGEDAGDDGEAVVGGAEDCGDDVGAVDVAADYVAEVG